MPFELTIRGFARVERELSQLARDFPDATNRALREEAEIEMGEAKERTPVKTGALRASGRVEPLGIGELGVRWVFGGPSIPYAIDQHENLTYFHRVGQAKFLESVLIESAPYLTERVAARMRQILGT